MNHHRIAMNSVASGNYSSNGMKTNNQQNNQQQYDYPKTKIGLKPKTKKRIIVAATIIGGILGGCCGIPGGPIGIPIGVVAGSSVLGVMAAIVVADM